MLDNPVLKSKTDLLDLALDMYSATSVLDVGGCWGVNGGYAFHAASNKKVKSTLIIDGSLTDLTKSRAEQFPNVYLKQGSLGNKDFVASLPKLGIAIIYDILLHQVKPDWNEFLALYAEKVDHFCIFNQDWVGPETIRFCDKGKDFYLENVTSVDPARTEEWFAKHNEHHPGLDRLWRDVFFFWQWGITSADIISTMAKLGFELDFFWNYGVRTKSKPMIEDRGYLFSRRGLYQGTAKTPIVSLGG